MQTPPWRGRVPWLASVAYVAILALSNDGFRDSGGWLSSLAALAIALVAAGRRDRAFRFAGWGFALVIASMSARAESRALEAVRSLGVLACCAAGCAAIARMPNEPGLVPPRRSSPTAGILVVGGIWWAAITTCVAPSRGVGTWMIAHERSAEWIAVAVSTAVLWASIEWTLRVRRLELGVIERVRAMRGLLGALWVAAVVTAVLGRVGVDRVALPFLAVAGVLLTGSALHPDAVRVGQLARRIVVLMIAGGGVAILGASAVASGFAADAWPATLATVAAAVAVGAAATALEAPMRPGGGAWLDAFTRAEREVTRGEPHDSIREVLLALRMPADGAAPSPELWTLSPPSVTTVDAAGYVCEREAALPAGLVPMAASQVEETLRIDALAALEVRQPEVRPLLVWMTDRHAVLATVIAGVGEPREADGVLVLPHGGRVEPVTLEEVRGFKRVADCLSAPCRARAAQARLLSRVLDANARAEAAEGRAASLDRERAMRANRSVLAAARLASPATVGLHSLAARAALDALERSTTAGGPIALVAPGGVDPVPYLARAHLAGPRSAAPLVLVDSTSAHEHDAARWEDPSNSPLAFADKGMLVLLDAAALPREVQSFIARVWSEGRPPWAHVEPLDVQIALTSREPPDQLVAEGRLDLALALRLSDARVTPIVLPRLRDRPEDLRALVTDHLARQGLRALGRPVGIEQAAYARLVEYDFPGDEAELAVIAERLVTRCAGRGGRDVVSVEDLDGFLVTS